MTKKKETFETVLHNLETEVVRLESGDLPLDEALACFEKGVKAAGRCQTMLDDAELKIEQLAKDSDGKLALAPFSSSDAEAGE